MPFEKLMDTVELIGLAIPGVTLGQIAEQLGEPVQRVMDAIDASKMLRGECTYIDVRE